jgi:hypothetical protein
VRFIFLLTSNCVIVVVVGYLILYMCECVCEFKDPSQIENVENQWKVRGAWDIRLDIRGIHVEEAISMGFHVASTVIPCSPFDWDQIKSIEEIKYFSVVSLFKKAQPKWI